MGMSFHCRFEKRTDKAGTGIILCGIDGQICQCQQYCPGKRKYEITAGYVKCGKRGAENGADRQDGKVSG